jgi:hypothetical protein
VHSRSELMNKKKLANTKNIEMQTMGNKKKLADTKNIEMQTMGIEPRTTR